MKQVKNNLTKSKGITLIALVVTIVVLIILAGVSINLVLGENGIVTKAKVAKLESKRATLEEEKELWKAEKAIADAEENNNTGKTLSKLLEELVEKNLITPKEKDEIESTGKLKIGDKEVVFVGEEKIFDLNSYVLIQYQYSLSFEDPLRVYIALDESKEEWLKIARSLYTEEEIIISIFLGLEGREMNFEQFVEFLSTETGREFEASDAKDFLRKYYFAENNVEFTEEKYEETLDVMGLNLFWIEMEIYDPDGNKITSDGDYAGLGIYYETTFEMQELDFKLKVKGNEYTIRVNIKQFEDVYYRYQSFLYNSNFYYKVDLVNKTYEHIEKE